MTQVSLTNIQNGDTEDANLFNSRFAAIVNVINGNIDASNIVNNSITYSKLNLSDLDIPVAKIALNPTVSTNAGTAGGSTNYIKIGTFLVQWGTTTALTAAATGNSSLYGITFPVAFATAPTVNYTPRANTVESRLIVFQQSDATTTAANIMIYNFGAAATAKVDWIAIGKSA